jgi:hypothetical protein
MEEFAHAVADFVRHHQAWAAPVVLVLAFGESLAFISLLIPAWGALVAIGALIGVSGISFWPVWIAGGIGAALGDWVSYWFGYRYKEHVAQMWPLSRYPGVLDRGEDVLLAVPDRQFRLGAGLVGGAAAVWRRDRAGLGMAVADGLRGRNKPRAQGLALEIGPQPFRLHRHRNTML